MIILLTSAAICTVLILASTILIANKQPKKQKGELLRVSETTMTAVMGVLMFAMSYFILWMKYTQPMIAGTDQTSYLYIAGFAIICTAIGCGIMFYTFLRKVIVYEDSIVFVTIWGGHKKMFWNEVTEIKVPPLTNKATFFEKKLHFTVGGEPKAYKAFLKIAKSKIKPEVGSDVLENLLNRSIF